MLTKAQVAAFEGGQLRILASGEKSREAVLALPLSRLLVRLIRVPADTDPLEFAAPILQAANPFPDDKLTIGLELVDETPEGRLMIAAALPESAVDDIGEALDAAKLSVVRIDALALGQLRGIWDSLGAIDGRRLVLLNSADCLSLIALDADRPTAIRAITDLSDLRREVMLSLLEAEDFGGAKKLDEIVVVEADSGEATSQSLDENLLSAFAPVRRITVGSDAALVGVAERTDDPSALNALPDSWREMLEETRFKHKLIKCLAIAGGIWALVMLVLFGVPAVYGFMTDRQKALSKQHARQYNAVKEMKAKVDLVRKYSDHARGALEIMKAVSDRLPEGITLSSWDYKRDDGVRVRGDADTAEATYAFKDAMDAMAAGDEEEGGEPIFGSVILNGPNASKGKYSFNLDCQYEKGEDE